MDILIVANFTGNYTDSDNGRFKYLAEMLSETNTVEIVTSSFDHELKQQRTVKCYKKPYKITWIFEPGYSRNICLRRFWSHYIWGKNVMKYVKNRKKPDVIYCAVPSLTGPALLAKYSENKGIDFIIDVQDLWPEAFQMVVDIPVVSRVGFAPFQRLANSIYKRADVVCAVSESYRDRALRNNKKCRESVAIFLGTELSTFDHYANEKPLLNKEKSEIWLAYCGTLGASYDLTCVIDSLSILCDESVKLIVMGDGPKKEEFEKYAFSKNVPAVFTGSLSYGQMCAQLSHCDISINPIMHGAAQSIINKHADYAAAGIPVLNTQECEEYRSLVEKYEMGFNCVNGSAKDLAYKMKILVENPKLRMQMGKNARKCAEEKFDRTMTYKVLAGIISGDK